jgi:hypothetical protein
MVFADATLSLSHVMRTRRNPAAVAVADHGRDARQQQQVMTDLGAKLAEVR